MKIWVIEIGEPLPLEKGERLLRYGLLSQEWAKLGHSVTWWTSSFSHRHKCQVKMKSFDAQLSNVRLIAVPGCGYSENISLKRVLHQLVCAIQIFWKAAFESKPDSIIACVPSPETALAGFLLSKLHKVPFFLDLRDAWPIVISEALDRKLRAVASPILWIYKLLIRFLCKKATGLLSPSESFLNFGLTYGKRTRNQNDRVIPFTYTDSFDSNQPESPKTQKLTSEGKFNICFIGSFGKFVDLDLLCKIAKEYEQDTNFQLILCGNTPDDQKFLDLCTYKNVIYLGWLNAREINTVLKVCQVGIAPYLYPRHFSLSNKIVEYLSGGLVVLSSLDGEVRALLEEYQCGLYFPPGNFEKLKEIIDNLRRNSDIVLAKREAALNVFQSQFSLQKVSTSFLEHLKTCLT